MTSSMAPENPQTLTWMLRLGQALRAMASRPSGAIGLAIVLIHLFVAVCSPWLVPFDYKAISSLLILSPPDSVHWWGTDHLGRDVFTRTLLGGREAILVTLIATPLAVAWGGFVGIYLGLVGGKLDDVLMRLVDAFLALPWILKMLLMIATFGTGLGVLIPTLAFFYGIPVIRIARAAAHNVVARDFVLAARARGHGRLSTIGRELLPNVLDALLVEGAMRWSWMLLAFSSLSFFGIWCISTNTRLGSYGGRFADLFGDCALVGSLPYCSFELTDHWYQSDCRCPRQEPRCRQGTKGANLI